MEFDENNIREGEEEGYVEIYSKKAVFGFSVFPAPFVGGILLLLNLKEAGYKKAILPVLIFTIFYYLLTNLVLNEVLITYKVDLKTININTAYLFGAFFAMNIIGGIILTQYFFKKYFPDNDYYPKSIARPLLIIIFIIFVLGLMSR